MAKILILHKAFIYSGGYIFHYTFSDGVQSKRPASVM